MKSEVQWSEQVRTFVAAQAPESRKRLRVGIRGLGSDRGEIEALVDDLLGYKRLRVGDFRVVYREAFERGVPVRKCLFVERRSLVYELFRKMVLDDIR